METSPSTGAMQHEQRSEQQQQQPPPLALESSQSLNLAFSRTPWLPTPSPTLRLPTATLEALAVGTDWPANASQTTTTTAAGAPLPPPILSSLFNQPSANFPGFSALPSGTGLSALFSPKFDMMSPGVSGSLAGLPSTEQKQNTLTELFVIPGYESSFSHTPSDPSPPQPEHHQQRHNQTENESSDQVEQEHKQQPEQAEDPVETPLENDFNDSGSKIEQLELPRDQPEQLAERHPLDQQRLDNDEHMRQAAQNLNQPATKFEHQPAEHHQLSNRYQQQNHPSLRTSHHSQPFDVHMYPSPAGYQRAQDSIVNHHPNYHVAQTGHDMVGPNHPSDAQWFSGGHSNVPPHPSAPHSYPQHYPQYAPMPQAHPDPRLNQQPPFASNVQYVDNAGRSMQPLGDSHSQQQLAFHDNRYPSTFPPTHDMFHNTVPQDGSMNVQSVQTGPAVSDAGGRRSTNSTADHRRVSRKPRQSRKNSPEKESVAPGGGPQPEASAVAAAASAAAEKAERFAQERKRQREAAAALAASGAGLSSSSKRSREENLSDHEHGALSSELDVVSGDELKKKRYQRRLELNRQSAAVSRVRRREYVKELEEKLVTVEKEKFKLQSQVDLISDENNRLRSQMKALQSQMGKPPTGDFSRNTRNSRGSRRPNGAS